MIKKYELINETKEINGVILHRIKALKDFNDVKKGELGGWIEKEENLSHNGNCWVYSNAYVFDDAKVYNNACISGNACVYGDACVCDDAYVCGNAHIYDNACVFGNACVYDNAHVFGYAHVYGYACVFGYAHVYNNARVYGYAYVYGNAQVYGNARIYGDACVYDDACICNDACVCNNTNIKSKFDICTFSGFGTEARNTTAYRCKDNLIRINCSCFNGTLEEFRNRIKETRKDKIQREYLLIADVIEEHFKEE